ncbi:inositol-3-phosphate synthase [Mangrovihabitans endophyticus]|uniref:Inositol-3-phosphate synthase n=1 Tax=Mangrovihabitans endophyticus TaxID=1751298 RepID=A0A8J3BYF0_9ACTN|nr:inositol-3-phosphate synthase [Mangrovihabitans endophyticus]GGK82089.1 inositol-3-phosphate synthase [Mangrovihabitans endophyticus]
MKLAIAGVGNNISALIQGIAYYGMLDAEALPGVARPVLGGIAVTDIETVAVFDLAPNKVGKKLSDAMFAEPNNYPKLETPGPASDPEVTFGIADPTDRSQIDAVAQVLRDSGAEVFLYSLPTGLPELAAAYGRAAVDAGVAVVNCTPDPIAGLPALFAEAREKNIPMVGDDLQSHIGSSIVHGTVLSLLEERGITLTGSYQLNIGGNADFKNLREHGGNKEASKHRALRQKVGNTDSVTVIPSAGFVAHLHDRKIAHMSVEGRGWAGMPVRLEISLQVQDSSNAAGVIIDLIRIAAIAARRGEGGFPVAATQLLKSPQMLTEWHEQVPSGRAALSALAADHA